MSKSLEELADIYYGKDYKNNPTGEDVPIYGTGGLMGFTSKPLNSGPAVLTGRKGSINNPIYVEGEFWNVDTIFCIKAKEKVDAKWLYYNLKNEDLSKLNEATGVPSVSASNLYRLKFRFVKHDVQQKIAKIISTCDEVIEKTEASIAKYEAIKKGMMQDLFTRGIDLKTGMLRPTYQDAPELYKPSKLGMIPKEWNCFTLGSLLKENPTYGINASATSYKHTLPTYIRITDIDENGNFLKENRKSVDHPLSENYFLNEGDLVFARTGATVGKTYLFDPNDGRLVYAGFLIKVSPNPDLLDYHFLKFLTETDYYWNWVEIMSQRSGQPGINGSEFSTLLVPTPEPNEQSEISKRLISINDKINGEKESLMKLKKIKSGVMQDLLSGKVEVNVENEELANQN